MTYVEDAHGVMEVDEVSLHRWSGSVEEPGELIGESIRVTGPGRVAFPQYQGTPTEARIVAWRNGQALWMGAATKWGWIYNGDIWSIEVPIPYTISSV